MFKPHHFVLHIPHSSSYIPDESFYNEELLEQEINLLTDWASDEIFKSSNITTIKTAFSRVFCDVERLPDKDESMFKKGMGIYYTHTDNNRLLRKLNNAHKEFIIKEYYQKHHEKLLKIVNDKLSKYDRAVIIDCHTFSSKPLIREFDQSNNRPDICLGTDSFHTSDILYQELSTLFKSHGFSVEKNKPYSGTIVPLPLYQKDSRVQSIMIEINKKLYMDEISYKFNSNSVQRINSILIDFFNNL
jgi:N-formylglutamate amidohydrolase